MQWHTIEDTQVLGWWGTVILVPNHWLLNLDMLIQHQWHMHSLQEKS